jgi:hypothetical protein
MTRIVELANITLSEDEVVQALITGDELQRMIAREVWNLRHPEDPIGDPEEHRI